MPEEITAPEEGQPTEKVVPSTEEATKVPDKFQGKSTEEVVKAYEELSKTIGKQGEELGRTKKEKEELAKQIDNWKKLGEVIEADPELFKRLEEKIKPSDSKSNGEATDDVRATISSGVVRDFEQKYGIDKLDSEKAQALRAKIGQEVQEFSGQNINEIPLSKLNSILEKGYTLATASDKEETARRQGYLEARENREAEFGTIPASGVKSNNKPLTPEEEKVARRLGVSPEEYAKYKDN